MKLFVVRHGETIENATGYIMGHNPGRLTKEGVAQSKLLGKRLAKEKIDIFYCSDLRRTKDTLKEVLKYHKKTPVVYSPDIRERNLGVFQGKKRNEVNWNKLSGSFMNQKPKGGESLMELKKKSPEFF